MLRLPGTFNCKLPGEATKCYAKYINQDFRYTLDDFERLKVGPNGTVVKEEPTVRTPSKVVPMNDIGEAAANSAQLNIDTLTETGEQYFQDSTGITITPGGSPPMQESRPSQPVRSRPRTSEPPPVLEYQEMTEVEAVETLQTEVVEVEELSDTLADEIVNKVVERLSGRLLDELVDKIVERLYKHLTENPSRDPR
jgi:hypothetical protein